MGLVLVGMILPIALMPELFGRREQTPPAAFSLDQAVKAVEDYGGFVKRDPLGRVFQVNLVYDEDAEGNRRECANTSDRIAMVLPAFGDLEELMLRGPQASDFAMQYGNLENLGVLDIYGARVSEETVQQIQRNLKKLGVFFK